MKAKTNKLEVVFFDDLLGAMEFHENETFDSVSYGDAEYTLVYPSQLLKEMGDMEGDSGELAKALKDIPEGVYVALRG